MRVVAIVLCIVLAGGLAIGVARADDESDRNLARREFALGQAADRQRDWQAAIDHYLRANDLVPHPNAMFNIAVDYERLGKLREAALWYQRYADTAADSPDRDRVIRTLRELATRPGTLTVRSSPSGARVTIDGVPAGVTPWSRPIKGGAHRVAIELDGEVQQREVRIEYGEPASLDVTMRGPQGTLVVVGTPPGAQVIVDNVPAGTIPASIPVAPGSHDVQVIADGHAPFVTVSTIEPNRETVVEAKLARALGSFDRTREPSQIGYTFGMGGGADAGGLGSTLHFEVGARLYSYDLYSRFGKTGGLSAIEFGIRWALSKSKLSPFLGAGYSLVTSNDDDQSIGGSSGYALSGGLRFDALRGEHAALSLAVESGLRYYPGIVSDGDPDTTGASGLIVPVMATFQLMYR